jgi:hypothetical protein
MQSFPITIVFLRQVENGAKSHSFKDILMRKINFFFTSFLSISTEKE